MNIVEKIFSYKKDKEFKTWRLFGIKIKKRYRRCNKSKPFPSDEINRQLSLQSLYSTHGRIFPQFKNINNGKDVVIVATGPTLAKYKSIKDAVHIGVNRAYQFDKIKLRTARLRSIFQRRAVCVNRLQFRRLLGAKCRRRIIPRKRRRCACRRSRSTECVFP